MRFCKMAIGCLFVSLLPLASYPQRKSEHITAQAVRNFVNGFYSWYVPVANRDIPVPAFTLAIRDKRSDFSPNLRVALEKDHAAQVKASETSGDLVGIDFDPFLATQDPCKGYQVGKVTRKGKNYLVSVYAICEGTKEHKPDVTAELTREGNALVFVNFHYPPKDDLLSILAGLRRDRREDRK